MEKLLKRHFDNVTSGELIDGYWHVTVKVTEKFTYADGRVVEEFVDALGIDRSFDAAHKTALRSVLQWLEENVYSIGFDSLVMAVSSKKELENHVKQEPYAN